MSEVLFQYNKISPTTWVYLSSLLIITIFFKFNRFWSVRNLDLVLLILLAPGLLMVNQSMTRQETAEVTGNGKPDPSAAAIQPPADADNLGPAETSPAATGP